LSDEQKKPAEAVLVPTPAEVKVLEALRALVDVARAPLPHAHPMSFRSGMGWDGKPAGKQMTMIERYLISIGRGPPPGGWRW
jgi:hypothetical protein